MAKKPVVPLDLFFDPKGTKDIFKEQKKFQDSILKIIKDESSKSEYKKIKVYTLGSLSYGGLCPYSDIDLLVVGEKHLAEELSLGLGKNLSNVKIKWWPKLDFELATDIFDHISLFFLKALSDEDEASLLEFKNTQSKWIHKDFESYQVALSKDRQLRRSRYGQVGGELSPNLKYGPGGLRDSCQALAWCAFRRKKSSSELTAGGKTPASPTLVERSSTVGASELDITITQDLTKNLTQIYQLRFALQLLFQTDQMSLEFWSEILKRIKKDTEQRKLYYQILYHQYFLTDLVFSTHNASKTNSKKILDLKDFNFENKDVVNAEESKQHAYALNAKLTNSKADKKTQRKIFSWIHSLFLKTNEDWQIDFILDSGFLVILLPEWNHIFGLTQSDHYHKYTVSEHLRQTLKSVCKLQSNSISGFSLENSMGELSAKDWQILKWVAIFHDLKKGHEEEHSVLGKQSVMDFLYFSEDEKSVVANLVEHHLRLSTFAFRYEHSDRSQLESLNELFVDSHWIRLLLIFTGADILGSNPQAWNKWKADQLYFAYKSLMDFRNDKINVDIQDIEGFELSPQLVKVIGIELLKEDIILLMNNKENDIPKEDWLVESIDQNLWVRVFKKDSGPGTLSHILNILYNVGLPVEQAFIASGTDSFVYNWFRLPLTYDKPKKQIQKRLELFTKQKEFNQKNLFAKIDRVIFLTENQGKLSFVFKGQDQNGVLLFISKIFETLGVNIQKAQINTWGQRIEDLFVVKKANFKGEDLLDQVQNSLKLPQSIKI